MTCAHDVADSASDGGSDAGSGGSDGGSDGGSEAGYNSGSVDGCDPDVGFGDGPSLNAPSLAADGQLLLDGAPPPEWLASGLRRGLYTSDVINLISGQPLLQEPQVRAVNGRVGVVGWK